MSFRLPRINILISDARGYDSQGELNLLSLGFGIHQAWICSSIFGTSALFSTYDHINDVDQWLSVSPVTDFSLTATIVFILSLFFIGFTDQKFLPFYTSKKVLGSSAILTSLGTFLLFASNLPGPLGWILSEAGAVIAGCSSALLLVFWGIAFARKSCSSIVLNGIVAITISLLVYTALLYLVPDSAAPFVVALLPLVELPMLQSKTPESYIVRHEVPKFRPLPVNKLRFGLRLGLPLLATGLALGSLRSITTQLIIPSEEITASVFIVIAACMIALFVLVSLLFAGAHRYWDSLFRAIVPLVMITMCCTPLFFAEHSIATSIALTTGFICLEALMWIFLGQLCQTFRLSAAYIFGVGRGCLAFGSLVGIMLTTAPPIVEMLMPFGEASGVLVYLAALSIAYVALPRVTDIKRMIDPAFDSKYAAIDMINDRADELRRIVDLEEGTAVQARPSDFVAEGAPGEGIVVSQPTHNGFTGTSCPVGAAHAGRSHAGGSHAGFTATAACEVASAAVSANAGNAGMWANAATAAASASDFAAVSTSGTTAFGGAAPNAASTPNFPGATSATDFASSGATHSDNEARTFATQIHSGETVGQMVGDKSAAAGVSTSSTKMHGSSSSSASPSIGGGTGRMRTTSTRPSSGASASHEVKESNKGGGNRSNRFRSQCEKIANEHLLSRRETEVLFLLAKGHNAAYIQKKLCITQSTAKTHIYHIYQKLDIHTQQELLAMVSDLVEE